MIREHSSGAKLCYNKVIDVNKYATITQECRVMPPYNISTGRGKGWVGTERGGWVRGEGGLDTFCSAIIGLY